LPEKFSIITASYNNSQYLKDWSDSIILQKYRPLEVIFVNDHSKDNTLDVIKEISNKFSENGIEFKVINNKDRQYCGTSYEIARSNATGNFLGVLDSDDVLVEGSVEYIMDLYIKNPEVTYIYTQFQICDKKLKFIKKGFCRHPGKLKTILNMGLRRIHGFSHWRTFSNRIIKPYKIFKQGLKCSVDKYMAYRLEESGIGMFTSKICYKYRRANSHCISRTEPSQRIWGNIRKETIERRKKYNLKIYPILEKLE
jgi:glycosyltransferase involved in cell wall biosynthesis